MTHMCSTEICPRNPRDSKARISFAALQPVSWPFLNETWVASVEGRWGPRRWQVLYGAMVCHSGKSLRCHVVAWFCPGAAPRLETHALKLLVKVQERPVAVETWRCVEMCRVRVTRHPG